LEGDRVRENKKDYMQKLVHEFGRKKEVGKDVRVEYTESLSVEEVKCLFRKVTLENVKYNQYVYTYSSEKEIRFMQERIRKIYEQDPISYLQNIVSGKGIWRTKERNH